MVARAGVHQSELYVVTHTPGHLVGRIGDIDIATLDRCLRFPADF